MASANCVRRWGVDVDAQSVVRAWTWAHRDDVYEPWARVEQPVAVVFEGQVVGESCQPTEAVVGKVEGRLRGPCLDPRPSRPPNDRLGGASELARKRRPGRGARQRPLVDKVAELDAPPRAVPRAL